MDKLLIIVSLLIEALRGIAPVAVNAFEENM